MGHFLPPEAGPLATSALEIKWNNNPAGTARAEWTSGETRTAIWILFAGHMRLHWRNPVGDSGTVELREPGDWVMWTPGVDHTWDAIEDSTRITIRWPSLP